MGSGLLGALLIEKIAQIRDKKRLSKADKQFVEIIEKYLSYVHEHPEDKNDEIENALETVLNILNK